MKTISKENFSEEIRKYYEEYMNAPGDDEFDRLIDLVQLKAVEILQEGEDLKVVVLPSTNNNILKWQAAAQIRGFSLEELIDNIDFNVYYTKNNVVKKQCTLKDLFTT